jgi:steroid 5-alpha reductase family enzyme
VRDDRVKIKKSIIFIKVLPREFKLITLLIISVLIFVHIFFFLAVVRKNFSVIDIGWGLGIALIASISYLQNTQSTSDTLLLFMTLIWGLRLTFFIFFRAKGKGEDPRYTKFRNEWMPHPNLNAYFKVYIFQGLLMLIVSLPISFSMSLGKQEFSALNWLGVLLWIIGFSFECWADYYLSRWKLNPLNSGKICTTGPWSISRFPNYFGEILLWYGIYFAGFSPESAWTILGPFTINFLIVRVTGIPPLENRYKSRLDYQEYAKRVPRLIPLIKF